MEHIEQGIEDAHNLKEISISATEPTADEVLWVKRGKNLLNFPSETISINGITSNVSGSTATISGTTEQSWANICSRYFGKALEAGTYTFSTDISLTNLTVMCRLYYEDNTFINMAVHRATGETSATVTVTKPIKSYYVYITDMTVGTVINSTVFNMQLQKGSVATDYEEYIDTTVNIKENGSFREILNIDQILKEVIPKNAGAHNAIYRGKDITDLFYNGTLSKQISAGTFDDIFIGDYIIGKTSGRKYLVADINYRLHCGNMECTKPHVLMIPERIMGTAQMNGSHVTTGGYVGSKMYTTNLAQFKTVIQNDFGSGHILNHRELLTNAVTDGKSSRWAWYDSTIELMNESMVYGHNVWGSHHGYETGIDKSQLSLFKHKPDLIVTLNDAGSRDWYWLRDVVSSSNFAIVCDHGLSDNSSAGNSRGVRPAFLIY